ncbi:MAG: RdgB/HAM1 family non-canonical purine NTP pyrophosphatase [Ruminococcaceae bacterium]|nr:RdgB/HAM1 family non-canonical purine NTP pyrophosphatase [Oscillospiraceae bacterium]
MKIVLASRNKHKISELQALLGEYIEDIEILSLDDVGIYGEIDENGSSFSENALIKARCAASSGYIGVGDDSGLEVDALDGAPGIYSARYAGAHGDDSANNALLLENLKGAADRSGRFVCAIACVFPEDGREICVRGTAEGEILCEYRGGGGFGYDPLFYYPPLDKTFGELSAEEKNKVSHRSDAIRKLAAKLKEER